MFGKAESATTLREVEEEPDYLWSCGTILGMFLFIVFMNEIDFSEKFYWGKKITTKLSKRLPIKNLHSKYIDDLTLTEAIDLKEDLKVKNYSGPFPPNFHERTGHSLNTEKFNTQKNLNVLVQYSYYNGMMINKGSEANSMRELL